MIHLATARVEPGSGGTPPLPPELNSNIFFVGSDGSDGDCPKIEFKSYLAEPTGSPIPPDPDDITFFAGPDGGGGLPPNPEFAEPNPPPDTTITHNLSN